MGKITGGRNKEDERGETSYSEVEALRQILRFHEGAAMASLLVAIAGENIFSLKIRRPSSWATRELRQDGT